jgi:tetratricopeptide (TPR) repeat protein
MGIAAIISIGQLAGIFATAAIAAEGDLSWRDRNQAQAEVSRLDREITTNPNEPNNYNERAMLKDKLGDSQGALADYNRAIDLAPNFTTAYLRRGLFRANRLNFPLGAFLDYNQAIQLDPTYSKAYLNRGILRCGKMNDCYIGKGDLRQAAQLARQQNKTDLYQLATNELSKWEISENASLIAVKPTAKSVSPVVGLTLSNPELPKPVKTAQPERQIELAAENSVPLQAKEVVDDFPTTATRLPSSLPQQPDSNHQMFEIPATLPSNLPIPIMGKGRGSFEPAVEGASSPTPKIATPVITETKILAVVGSNGTESKVSPPATQIVATAAPKSQLKQKAIAAYQRGCDKFKGNKKAAIAEYTNAIAFDANYADAYFNRGLARKLTSNKAGAIADLITAANIYRQQQQQANTDEAMSLVRELKGYKPRPKN